MRGVFLEVDSEILDGVMGENNMIDVRMGSCKKRVHNIKKE